MSIGLYIHIPFCRGKCPYCDFYSLPFEDGVADVYVKAVCEVLASGRFPVDGVDTVYFGGGTPSLMGAARLGTILNQTAVSYGITGDAEISIEANPTELDSSSLGKFRKAGINRISLGVQSGNDRELVRLGRRHSVREAEKAILSAHDVGFDNISADLMLAVPGQTLESMNQSLDFLSGLPLTHISAYMLKIEENTPFSAMNLSVDDDLSADLYLACVERLAHQGFPQYEISNFARPGKESRHNLKYWRCEPYLGIGPAAHSFLEGERSYFQRDMAGFLSDPFSQLQQDGPGGDFFEYAMLRLRLTEGLSLREAVSLYTIDEEALLRKAAVFLEKDLVRLRNGRLCLTPEGFLVSNMVISVLLN